MRPFLRENLFPMHRWYGCWSSMQGFSNFPPRNWFQPMSYCSIRLVLGIFLMCWCWTFVCLYESGTSLFFSIYMDLFLPFIDIPLGLTLIMWICLPYPCVFSEECGLRLLLPIGSRGIGFCTRTPWCASYWQLHITFWGVWRAHNWRAISVDFMAPTITSKLVFPKAVADIRPL